MFSTDNPCRYGAFYGVPCTADCQSHRAKADAIAWAAYQRAWPEAMAGAPTTGRLPMTDIDRDFGE